MRGLPPLQALRCFVAVARDGSVSSAASSLHLSQPAVSLQIKNLEERTALRLFHRTSAGLTLTREGAVLLADAEAAIGALMDFSTAVATLQGAARPLLRVGTILEPDFIRLGAFLKELIRSAPNVETQLRHGMSDDALMHVLRRELDVGFYLDLPAGPTSDQGRTSSLGGRMSYLRVRPLKTFIYRVAAPPGWASHVVGRDWRELAALPWLATPEASAHRRLLDSVFEPLGVQPQRVALTDQESSMIDLLKSGVGLSLVRSEIAQREARAKNLVLADRVRIRCAMSFVCLEARATEPSIAQALGAIERAWGSLSLESMKAHVPKSA